MLSVVVVVVAVVVIVFFDEDILANTDYLKPKSVVIYQAIKTSGFDKAATIP